MKSRLVWREITSGLFLVFLAIALLIASLGYSTSAAAQAVGSTAFAYAALVVALGAVIHIVHRLFKLLSKK